MSYNEGARIVPMSEANEMLRAIMGNGVELPTDEYARVQLLTEESARGLVDEYIKFGEFSVAWATLSYGELAVDFPLCTDFAKILLGLIVLACNMAGLSVRAYFFRLHYTKNAIDPKTGKHLRHAIDGMLFPDGRVMYIEPQNLTWIAFPEDLMTFDKVRL